MQAFILVFVLITVLFPQHQPLSCPIEMFINVTNSGPGVTRNFTAYSIHGVIWDCCYPNQYELLPNPDDYDNKSVEITGNYYGSCAGFDNNGNDPGYPILRYSEYQLSVSPGNATIIIDWQGCYTQGTGDVYVTYDASSNQFLLYNPPQSDDEDCLQPTDPSNLTVESRNGDLVGLQWTPSDQPPGTNITYTGK